MYLEAVDAEVQTDSTVQPSQSYHDQTLEEEKDSLVRLSSDLKLFIVKSFVKFMFFFNPGL